MTAPRARSRFLGAAAALAAATIASCSRGPRIEERPIVVYSPRACPVSQSQGYSFVYGAGDFEASVDQPPVASLFLRDEGQTMSGLPPATRAIVVDVSEPPLDVDWRGIAEVPKSGPVNVLVWPAGETCALTRNVDRRASTTLAVFGRHVIVVGGKLVDEPRVARTFVGDLSTGILEPLDLGLRTPRSNPTVTAFRLSPDQDPAPALVAGGENPDNKSPLATAEIYEPAPGKPGDLGDFDRSPSTTIILSGARKNHAAVVLASGDTVLVGGEDETGAVLSSIDFIDAKQRAARSENLAFLTNGRKNPTALRLASGEIFVAGGLDQKNDPVPVLEWLTPDVSANGRLHRPYPNFVMGRERAFVPLEAGGVLAVVAPTDADAGKPFGTVYVISADGVPEAAVSIDPKDLDQVSLFEGTGNAPVLYTGKAWLRWDPWFGAFERIPDAPTTGPTCRVVDGKRQCPSVVNGDPGLALWLEDRDAAGMYLTGWRFAARTRFDTLRKPLLVDGPSGLAPDRLAGIAGSSIRFERGRGLLMGPGASAFVTDVTFGDVLVELDVVDAAPTVVLRDDSGRELEVGGAACALTGNAQRSIAVTRKGKRVTVRADDQPERTCPTELADGVRVSIGVRGSAGTAQSGATNLRVTRR